VEGFGCSLHDTIQPGFSFLVGAALPDSLASRLAKGARFADLLWHALWRSVVLGVFLRSINHSMTYFTFEDTLSQIGFGYPFLFLLGYSSSKAQSLQWVWTSQGLQEMGVPAGGCRDDSIVAYSIAHLWEGFLDSTLHIHLGPAFFRFAGAGLEPFLCGAVILLCYWLILFWMYRRKLFLKI
jgi:predicted acyltransferase